MSDSLARSAARICFWQGCSKVESFKNQDVEVLRTRAAPYLVHALLFLGDLFIRGNGLSEEADELVSRLAAQSASLGSQALLYFSSKPSWIQEFSYHQLNKLSFWIHQYPELYLQKIRGQSEIYNRSIYSLAYLVLIGATYCLGFWKSGLVFITLHYCGETVCLALNLSLCFSISKQGTPNLTTI